MAAMRLTAWEEERLLVFSAAELARRHRDIGLPLNAPEAIALICDAMFEAARAGGSYGAVEAAGRAAVDPTAVMPGVPELVEEVRLEVLLGDGTRLIVLADPLGRPDAPSDPDGPGAIRAAADPADNDAESDAQGDVESDVEGDATARATIELEVRSESTRVIRVSSHYPFHRVNRRLVFDRSAAQGFRLDLPAGASMRWAPGETHVVPLVRFGGEAGRR
jgi:urease subunit gamma/beta